MIDPGETAAGEHTERQRALEIDVQAHSSLVALFDLSCRRFRCLPAFSSMGVTLAYEDVDRLSRSMAAYLQHELALNKADRFAIMLPNPY